MVYGQHAPTELLGNTLMAPDKVSMPRASSRVNRQRRSVVVTLGLTLPIVIMGNAFAQAPRLALVPYLEQRFGLRDRQVRGALGALLVFANQRLHPNDFAELAQRIPNAAEIMQEVKLQGVVTGPLDGVDEFEQTLSNLGIGQPLASQFAPAVVEYLGAAGFQRERDLLASVLS